MSLPHCPKFLDKVLMDSKSIFLIHDFDFCQVQHPSEFGFWNPLNVQAISQIFPILLKRGGNFDRSRLLRNQRTGDRLTVCEVDDVVVCLSGGDRL